MEAHGHESAVESNRIGFPKRSGTSAHELVYCLMIWVWLKVDSIGMFARESLKTFSCAWKDALYAALNQEKYKVAADSNHPLPVFENQLNRQFTVAKPDQVYVCDITYIRTQEGWLYLAIVIDLFSRKVTGWSMSSRMTATLVCDASRMAIWLRRPPPGLIVYSDRGSQYAGKAYRNLLKAYGFIGSMSRLGNCWDNAQLRKASLAASSRNVANGGITKTAMKRSRTFCMYIAVFYNNQRLHSYLDYKSPNQYEAEAAKSIKVA